MRLFKRKAAVRNTQPLPPKLTALLREAWWLLMAVTAVYLVITLASFSPADPSWSHSSADTQIRNYGGTFGAWLSDILLYLFGYAAWLLVGFCLFAIAWGYRKIEQADFQTGPMTWAALLGFLVTLVSVARSVSYTHLTLPTKRIV